MPKWIGETTEAKKASELITLTMSLGQAQHMYLELHALLHSDIAKKVWDVEQISQMNDLVTTLGGIDVRGRPEGM